MLYETYCRAYQHVCKIGMKQLRWRQPEVLEGEGCLQQLPTMIQQKGVTHVLIVTDQQLAKLQLHMPLVRRLHEASIVYTIFDETEANPTVQHVEAAYALYTSQQCDGVIAFGGGSAIDCAKLVAARVARPALSVPQMKGIFRIRKCVAPLFAIPTTAGTGSEATLAAVISNPDKMEKYPIMDLSLIPHVAVFDPHLTVSVPPAVTAMTGMDALTHAIEAYIGRSNTKQTLNYSREAVQLIFDNLYKAYEDGGNITARKNMQRAAYVAGLAFTRAYVGNVHAIAHTLGGFYNVPHGLANAVILPHMLRFYGKTVEKPLAELADLVGLGIGKGTAEQAKRFIEWIEQLNASMHIPTRIEGIVNRDIPLMVKRALAEANPLYPVPKIMNEDEMFYMYQQIQA